VQKTFNNHLGLELGLWRRKSGLLLAMPKTSLFGMHSDGGCLERNAVRAVRVFFHLYNLRNPLHKKVHY
jgi:hypothetical protein